MAKITISIPTYNRKHFLDCAIKSILNQTYQNFEILISDNGSTDGTEELALSYVASDKRITYHRFPINQGSAANWIYSLLTPQTELVSLLPDDDLLEKNCLEYAVKYLSHYQEASIYCSKVSAFGLNPNIEVQEYYPRWLSDAESIIEYDTRLNFTPILMGTPCAMPGSVYRNKHLKQINFIKDSSFAPGDYYFLAQLALKGTIVFNPKVLARYRWHQDNHSVKIRRTFRSLAQYHYALRIIAKLNCKKPLLDYDNMHKDFTTWPFKSISDLIIAFSSIDQEKELRSIGYKIYLSTVTRGITLDKVGIHYRLAIKLAWSYLTIADLTDRILGFWWRPEE